jgi:hypothetical protein
MSTCAYTCANQVCTSEHVRADGHWNGHRLSVDAAPSTARTPQVRAARYVCTPPLVSPATCSSLRGRQPLLPCEESCMKSIVNIERVKAQHSYVPHSFLITLKCGVQCSSAASTPSVSRSVGTPAAMPTTHVIFIRAKTLASRSSVSKRLLKKAWPSHALKIAT